MSPPCRSARRTPWSPAKDDTSSGAYTFGDSDVAAQRLRLVAETFAPSSQSFLSDVRRNLGHEPRLGADLGCGLGLTTRLLRGSLAPAHVVGLDRSLSFLDLAQDGTPEGVSFVEHDVTQGPLPIPVADVLYCRFLLTHLQDLVAALREWLGALAPGGVLAIEELEHLSSPHPVLAAYYEILEAMQQSHRQDTFVGQRLESLAREAGWVVRSSRVRQLDIGGVRMARLHLLNFRTWRSDPFVVQGYAPERIDKIERGLATIVAGHGVEPKIDYRLRQLVAAA